MIGQDDVAVCNAQVVTVLRAMFFIGETGKTKWKRERVLRYPRDLCDLCAGKRIGERLSAGIEDCSARQANRPPKL